MRAYKVHGIFHPNGYLLCPKMVIIHNLEGSHITSDYVYHNVMPRFRIVWVWQYLLFFFLKYSLRYEINE
jgi:hypothetical protein